MLVVEICQTTAELDVASLHCAQQMTGEFFYHGELISDGGVAPVAQALTECSWRVELHRSGYDGTLYLRTPRSQEIDLKMESGQSHRFLFSGGVDGTLERTLALLGEFSQCLSIGGFTHRVEIYDDTDKLVGYFHHRWPQKQNEPTV